MKAQSREAGREAGRQGGREAGRGGGRCGEAVRQAVRQAREMRGAQFESIKMQMLHLHACECNLLLHILCTVRPLLA